MTGRTPSIKSSPWVRSLPFLVGGLSIVIFLLWFFSGASRERREILRLALEHDRPAVQPLDLRNPGSLIPGAGQPSSWPGSWPQFRGADRSNVAVSKRPLAREWADSGPRVLWRIPVGEGYAGAAIHQGRVYIVDYDREQEEDAIRCLSLDDASEIWRYTYSVRIKRFHGMSRTIPAVTDDYVVALGPMCHLHCLDARTGELIWKKYLPEEFGVTVPPWYAGQCPLIEGDRLILAPGAKPLMMAVDLATGEIIWQTPPEVDDMGMTHSSIAAIEFDGRRQYVYCASRGAVGVDAEDGSVLWTLPEWTIGIANIPTPVWIGDDRIFFSGGYNKGSLMVRLVKEGGKIRPETLFRRTAREFGSDQQTPVLYEGRLYAVQPRPAEMVCMTLDGERLWSSGSERRFGLGPYMIVNDLLLILDDATNILHLTEANATGYRELARAKLFDGHEAWAPLAFAEGRLILRDLTEMICVDIGKTE